METPAKSAKSTSISSETRTRRKTGCGWSAGWWLAAPTGTPSNRSWSPESTPSSRPCRKRELTCTCGISVWTRPAPRGPRTEFRRAQIRAARTAQPPNSHSRGGSFFAVAGLDRRQRHQEHASSPRRRLHLDIAAMLAHDGQGDAQAESGAAAGAFGGEEGVEDFFQDVRGDARPIVLDGSPYVGISRWGAP